MAAGPTTRPSALAGSNEAVQALALERARRRATGLLVVVGVAFLGSFALPDDAWAGWVTAGLEAGLVGGLADWFAVVALFRHPLGIPIPHTAVIPRSKDGLGANLAGFVRDNFLHPDNVEHRVADPAHIDRLGAWLEQPANADRLASRVAGFVEAAFEGLDRDVLVARVVAGTRRRLDALPVSRMAGESLEEAVREGRHHALVDSVIEGLRAAVVRNRGPLRQRLGRESPAWVPEFVDDLVFDRADEVVRRFLADVSEHQDHELRRLLDEQLLAVTTRMQGDPATQDRVREAVRDVIDDEQLQEWVTAAFDELRRAVSSAADPSADGGTLRRLAVEAIVDLGRRLGHDEALRERLLGALRAAAPRLAETGQAEIGGIIAATIDRWDAQETSRRLETWMGPDLQFVRINGTVVGALVGLLLHGVTTVLA